MKNEEHPQVFIVQHENVISEKRQRMMLKNNSSRYSSTLICPWPHKDVSIPEHKG